MGINLSLKNVQKRLEQIDIADPVQSNTDSPMSTSPVHIKSAHELSTFFAKRVPYGLNYPPPKSSTPDLHDQETATHLLPLYGAPPNQIPPLPNLVQQLLSQQIYFERAHPIRT